MLKTVLFLLLAYIAYRFLFGFVLPVSKATRTVRRQFRDAREQMEAQMRQQQGYADPGTAPAIKKGAAPAKSEYIDFEEVK